ncbi:MAG: metal ABC transporter ATP-binding protein [Neomegalonema sp.]|nr:metal ABC transporter ATP-binding protein [Neomegalonema sp.]
MQGEARGGDRQILNALNVRGLTVSYDRKPVLWDVAMSVPAGARMAIIGPNGAGKSTLLKAALGLIPRLSGECTLFGAPVAKARDKVAYVPQRASVDWDFPASVLDVTLMGLQRQIGWLRWPGASHRAAARGFLDQVGMADFADRPIGQLSGGQQQRVFLARALAQQAPLLVLDEPFAGIDAATEHAIIDVLHRLSQDGRTILAVHHDLGTASQYFDRALLLSGTVIAEGAMDQVLTPAKLQAAYGGRLAASQLEAFAAS